MEKRKIRDAEDARNCLAAIQKSGVSLVEWTHRYGIHSGSLNAWRMTFARMKRKATLGLVELTPGSRLQNRHAQPATPPPVYRLRCGAFEVEAPANFEEQSLGRLLRLVASC